MLKRSSGVLLHVSSLPSPFGIGDMGPGAFRFVDFLSAAQQKYWQILPLNPTDAVYGSSPYSSVSAFAVNMLFISPESLVEEGWLSKGDLADHPVFEDGRVNYELVAQYKADLFPKAYAKLKAGKNQKEFQAFCEAQSFWLDDFASFIILKIIFKGTIWNQWPSPLIKREASALAHFRHEQKDSLERIKFYQYLAFSQWAKLKKYAASKGVQLIGDIPIYVNYDSADVWGNPQLFKLDKDLNSVYVAGVPPDYFSETGQRWGNPVYRWDILHQTNYDWWLKRVGHNLKLFDCLRIDHFRGLVAFWQIPAFEKTAVRGEWCDVPTEDFLNAIKRKFPSLPIIAEDLGIITPDVTAVMEKFQLPGMKILLFAFGGDLKTHPYIPENYTENCVVYTGTHDNNTVRGWFENDTSEHEKNNLYTYLGAQPSSRQLPWMMVEMAMKSKASLSIVPLQDLLGLGKEARMNVPATVGGNWEWRALEADFRPPLVKNLRTLTEGTGR